MNIVEEMKMMIAELNYHTKLYDEGHPIWSDKEWDEHYFRLVDLEKKFGIIMPYSPTQKIDYEVVNELKKVKHNHPMLSLDKTKDMQQFINYFTAGKDVIGMLKFDGLTCSLRYLDGKLVSAETRGNGEVGEDILHNAKVIPSIPNQIEYKDELILDGEIICTDENFKEFSEEYANSRNFAAGSIRLLDSKECFKRKLTFVVWNVVKGYEEEGTFHGKLSCAEHDNFLVTPRITSLDWDWAEYLQKTAKEFGYPIDGLVGRYDDIVYGESLGTTGHHTKAAYAFKFYDEEHKTVLRNIEWTMGRTGILTPVAIFDPLEIEGSVVSRASLHNISVMENLSGGFERKGDILTIYKANMIIPQVSAWEHPEDQSYSYETHLPFPEFCPVCGEITQVKENGNVRQLVCSNPKCAGKLINRIDHYCSKKGVEIKGLSKATLEKLIDWGWIEKIQDIYFLVTHTEEWVRKSGFGYRSVEKILEAIDKSKKCEMYKFISAIGIPLIGQTYAKELCKNFNSWDAFREAVDGDFDFAEMNGFGEEMHNALKNYDYSEADYIVKTFLNLSNSLRTIPPVKVVLDDEVVVIPVGETKLKNKTIVITGKLTEFKNRNELKDKIEKMGGKVTGSVSKKTNYLINNDTESTTEKNRKAREYGIPILSEKEFISKFFD